MKKDICIHMQDVMYKDIRGVPYSIIELTTELIKRNANNYFCSFFDYNKERNNDYYLRKYLRESYDEVNICECNTVSYKVIIDGLRNRNDSLYDGYTYEEYIGCRPDIIYFPYASNMPHNVSTKHVITTVYDVMAMMEKFSFQFTKSERDRMSYSMEYISENKDIVVTTISQSTKNDIQEIYEIPDEQIKVVYMGYNKNKFYPDEEDDLLKKLGVSKPFLLYLGALDSRKGLDLIEKIGNSIPKDIQIVVAGAFQSNIDKELFNKLIMSKKHILTGYVSEDEKRQLMSMAEIFLFPSYYEGFGLPVLEAMACGTPVITADNSSLPEVGGEAAMYFETGNSESLVEKIDILLDNNNVRKEYVDKGYKQIKNFSWEKTAEQMEDIFERIVNES